MTATIEPVQISLLTDNGSLPDPEAVLARFADHYAEALVRHRELAQRLAIQAADVDAAAEALEDVADFESLMADTAVALDVGEPEDTLDGEVGVAAEAPEGAAAEGFEGEAFEAASFEGEAFEAASFEGEAFEAASFEGEAFEAASFDAASFDAAPIVEVAETGELDMPALFDTNGGEAPMDWDALQAAPVPEVQAFEGFEGLEAEPVEAAEAEPVGAVEAEAVAYAAPDEAASSDYGFAELEAQEATPVPFAAPPAVEAEEIGFDEAFEATPVPASALDGDEAPPFDLAAAEVTPVPVAATPDDATAMFDIADLPDELVEEAVAGDADVQEATTMFSIDDLPDDDELDGEVLELGADDEVGDEGAAEAAPEPAAEGAPRSGRKGRKKKKK